MIATMFGRRHLASAVVLAAIVIGVGAAPVMAKSAPTYLKQGWSAAEREWFYSFSQGSQLLPYPWFTALELPDSETRFAADGLARFGYLPRPPSEMNPDGLPVGFAVDRDRVGDWIGMNCAACHTNRIEFRNQVLQIDGAPGNGDLYALLDGLNRAMQATIADPAKLDRFIKRIAGASPDKTKAQLTQEFKDAAADFAGFVTRSTSPTAWGPARTDAFGMIFNRVTAIDLNNFDNSALPIGPVSYPFLWTTNRQDFIQWNGSVPNLHVWERLGRNVGQVLGVFGKLPNLKDPHTNLHRFETSVHAPELLRVDRDIDLLTPPQLPAEATTVDVQSGRVARGAVLYKDLCVSCHVDAATASGPLITKIVSAADVGTDPVVATTILARKTKTGPLMKSLLKPKFDLEEEPTADVLSKVVMHTILGVQIWKPSIMPGSAYHNIHEALSVAHRVTKAEILTALANRDMKIYLAANPRKSGPTYKAGPLNGVWATAPYLHNGSVPTLADLLLPAAERPKTFTVGSRRFDEAKVGFASGEGDGSFKFDTTLPGNGNGGHDGTQYGTTLNPEERLDLIAYLKTL